MKTSVAKACTFLMIGSLLVFSACKKDSDKVKAKADILTTSSWKYSTAGYDLDNNGTVDGTLPAGLVQTCDIDNTVTFKSDKTGVVDEGSSKCSASSPQTTSFTWALGNNDTELIINGAIFAGIDGTVKIVELSDTKMVISKQITVAGFPLPIPVIVTLVH